MRTASELAEWWEEQRRTSMRALDDFVDAYPNWFGVAVAGTAATAMDLGAGLVDVLRLGEGAAEGSVSGIAKDALRLLQVAPALGKAGRFGLARVVSDPGGGICTWVAATKALRQVGAKAFGSVSDLAEAAGLQSTKHLAGAFVHELTPVLQKLGARVASLGKPANLEAVNASVRGDGVVLFSVEWSSAGKQVGHTIYAFRDSIGRLFYADRTGVVVRTLQELERFYAGIGSAKVYGTAAFVQGPRIMIVDGLGVLCMEVLAKLAVPVETAAQTLEIRKQVAINAIPPPSARLHTVITGDSLSKIARSFYGDLFKWPIIYEANRTVIGPNPNLIRPGQKLHIPALPQVRSASAMTQG
jgi:nucleoid-associated protein YgaU